MAASRPSSSRCIAPCLLVAVLAAMAPRSQQAGAEAPVPPWHRESNPLSPLVAAYSYFVWRDDPDRTPLMTASPVDANG
jgi:hypothetical protein